MKAIKRILVPVDYSAASHATLEAALWLAKTFGASVEVIHAWSDSGYVDATIGEDVLRFIERKANDEMTAFISKFEPPEGVTLRTNVQQGVPWQIITAVSGDFDLIVMSTHGRSGLSHLVMGSVAERVVRLASCPVLTMRGDQVAEPQRQV